MVLNSKSRPLSPHLTIYKAQLTSSLSIFHRISGVSLALGFIFYILYYSFTSYYLISYPFYNLSLSLVNNNLFIWILIIIFSLLTIALHYHATNGLRHIFWDFGFFLDIKNVYYSGFIGCFIAILWFIINSLRFIYS
jgi:succinate dehydrogenase cytochrome b556 subunit